MTLKQFRKLKARDFGNGAVTDEIEKIIEQHAAIVVAIERLLDAPCCNEDEQDAETADAICECHKILGIVNGGP